MLKFIIEQRVHGFDHPHIWVCVCVCAYYINTTQGIFLCVCWSVFILLVHRYIEMIIINYKNNIKLFIIYNKRI